MEWEVRARDGGGASAGRGAKLVTGGLGHRRLLRGRVVAESQLARPGVFF